MRERLKRSIQRLTEKATEFSSPVLVTYVDPEGVSINVTALRWSDTRLSAEGIQIFSAGVEDQEQQIFRFERAGMEVAGISRFDVSGHFLVNSQRWDVVGGHQQAFCDDPSATVILVLRKAIEKSGAVCGSTFDFETDDSN